MKISSQHWLVSESPTELIKKDPSQNAMHNISPKYLIIHYTAGDTADAAINWFKSIPPTNPDKICAHIVVDFDGTINQLVSFDRKAHHAGYSSWDGLESLNGHSIGIEIVNPGYCEKLADGSFRRVIGKNSAGNLIYKNYPASEANRIIQINHKHKFWTDIDNSHWFKFPQPQLNAVYQLSKLLIEKYGLITAIGHDDISPARKPDPGPAFPWDEFKQSVFGRVNDIGKIFIVNSADGFANFRTNHDTSASSVVIKRLNNGYEVGLIETFGQWSKVYLVNTKSEVVNSRGESIKSIGWIHSSLLAFK